MHDHDCMVSKRDKIKLVIEHLTFLVKIYKCTVHFLVFWAVQIPENLLNYYNNDYLTFECTEI